jgi:hypothetical protein
MAREASRQGVVADVGRRRMAAMTSVLLGTKEADEGREGCWPKWPHGPKARWAV